MGSEMCIRDSISAAPRADFAEAAVAILAAPEPQAGKVYELAGSTSFTFADLAAMSARISGRPVEAVNLPKPEFEAAIVAMGMPAFVAGLIAKSDFGASEGGLLEEGRTMERVIGRPTLPMEKVLEAALRG